MQHRSSLPAFCLFACGVLTACLGPGISIESTPENFTIKSTMRPIERACGAPEVGGVVPPPADARQLYWLGECDEVFVRWSAVTFQDTGIGRTVDLCNPSHGRLPGEPPFAFVDQGEVALVGYPGAMLGAGAIRASYFALTSGCEGGLAPIDPPPPNHVPDGDYVLTLITGDNGTIGDEILQDPGPRPEASIHVAHVGAMPRTMAPRLLTAENCDDYNEALDRCDQREYTFRGDRDVEWFSENVRIARIRVLRGRQTGGRLAGIEGAALTASAGFECDRNASGDCIALPFEWVDAGTDEFRCSNDPDDPAEFIEVLSQCGGPDRLSGAPLNANPHVNFDGATTDFTPRWTVNFKRSTGFPPPETERTALAIEFTLVSVP